MMKNLFAHTAHVYAIALYKSDLEAVYEKLKPYCPCAAPIGVMNNFKANTEEVVRIPCTINGKPAIVVLVGLGEDDYNREHIRRSIAGLIRNIEKLECSELVVDVSLVLGKDASADMVQTLAFDSATSSLMAFYKFDRYITKKTDNARWNVTWHQGVGSEDDWERGYAQGVIVGEAVNRARTWCDTPPCDMNPYTLAEEALALEKSQGIKVRVIDEQQACALGMGGLCGVAQGSEQDACLVIMEYTPKTYTKTIGLVGKGITFDSGGLSIKPADAMETMKDDMSGAASVIATMGALAALKLPVRVIGVAPIAENMPSGTALRPGDIIRFYNGVTAEVRNTDAEGRLILADALAYITKEYELDELIDIATLTGACSHALGPLYAGIMGRSQDLIDGLVEAGEESGDHVWQLPFDRQYKKAIKSDIADIKNTGNARYRAGAITAGHFLAHFVPEHLPWVHIDSAGTAFDVPDISYYRSGATGFGVRLFVAYVTKVAREG